MELQKTKHQLALEKWETCIRECRNSGQTVKSWCAENGIKPQTYYRWQKLVCEAGTTDGLAQATENEGFAEYHPIAPKNTPAAKSISAGSVVIHLACGKVEIQNGADSDTIAATLHAMQSLC